MPQPNVWVELKGLKFEIGSLTVKRTGDGDHSKLPAAVAKQLGSLLSPGVELVESALQQKLEFDKDPPSAQVEKPAGSGITRRAARSRSNGSAAGASGLDLPEAAAKICGQPSKAWSTLQKAMWLLFGFKQAGTVGLSGASIVATFKRHFEAAGELTGKNIKRDLKPGLDGPGAVLAMNNNVSPGLYVLTPTGEKVVETLIAKAAADGQS
jgi:hypothetical protein